jgi:hypothetical protein
VTGRVLEGLGCMFRCPSKSKPWGESMGVGKKMLVTAEVTGDFEQLRAGLY